MSSLYILIVIILFKLLQHSHKTVNGIIVMWLNFFVIFVTFSLTFVEVGCLGNFLKNQKSLILLILWLFSCFCICSLSSLLFLTLSGPTFWRAWFGRGGAQRPPPRKSLKEMSETPYCYLEVRPLSKLGTHEKFRVEISKTGWDFMI